MTPYWLLFLMPIFAVLSPLRPTADFRRLLWFLVGALLVYMIGLRFEVGGDWVNYSRDFQWAAGLDFDEIFLKKDPGAVALNWAVANLGLNIYVVNTLCALPFVVGLVVFCRHQPLPWLALAVAVPYLVTVVGMGYTRQSTAIGFLMLGLVELGKQRQLRFVLLVLAGTLFHQAALLMLPIGALVTTNRSLLRAVSIVGLFFIIALTILWSAYDKLWQYYVVEQMESEGGAIRVAMSAVAAVLFLVVRRHWRARWPDAPLWTWVSLLTFVCVGLVPFASTAVDRMALYFIPLQLAVFSRLPILLRDRLVRTCVVLVILAGYAAVLWVWLNFATHSGYWLPYKNVTALPLVD